MLGFAKKTLPKIVIKYGKLIDPIFLFYCKNNPDLKERGWNDWIPPNADELSKKIDAYKEEWRKYEEDILNGIYGIFGLKFRRNTIDVYVVSGTPRQSSDPLIFKSGFNPDEFVDALTHELIHALFQDNSEKFPISILKEMFPQETRTTMNHVMVHAALKYIYLNILKDEARLRRNVLNSRQHETDDYIRAWDIVEKEGYIELTDKLRNKLK